MRQRSERAAGDREIKKVRKKDKLLRSNFDIKHMQINSSRHLPAANCFSAELNSELRSVGSCGSLEGQGVQLCVC